MKQCNTPLLGITVLSGLSLTFLLFFGTCSRLFHVSPMLKDFLIAGLLIKFLLELYLLKTFLQAVYFSAAEQKIHEKDG